MNTPRYAVTAAKLIRQYLPSVTVVAGDESRGVATIERAMRARARRRKLVGLGGVLAAAAIVLVIATQLTKGPRPVSPALAAVSINVTPSGNGAALARSEGDEPLTTRVAVESGQRIETPRNGGASLQLSTGTSLSLSGQTSFRVDSQGTTQRFSLQRGELVAHVAKLTTTQRFIIDTPDAEVEVRGTRFRLRVVEQAEQCGAGTRTRLAVTEGAVEVRVASLSAISVKAGETWPADCREEIDVPLNAPSRPSPVPTPALTPKHEGRAATAAQVNEAERSSALAPQNDLFAEGVARGRQGDTSGALRVYQALITRFPTSPLAENAMVARMRLLVGPDARAEAKRYVARYPNGFASDEAKKLLAEP